MGSLDGIDGYRLFVTPAPPSTDGEFEVQLSQTIFLLQNLAFFTEYSIQISVYNENGNGIKTSAVTLTTGEGGKCYMR